MLKELRRVMQYRLVLSRLVKSGFLHGKRAGTLLELLPSSW
jgi:hypothetical protein